MKRRWTIEKWMKSWIQTLFNFSETMGALPLTFHSDFRTPVSCIHYTLNVIDELTSSSGEILVAKPEVGTLDSSQLLCLKHPAYCWNIPLQIFFLHGDAVWSHSIVLHLETLWTRKQLSSFKQTAVSKTNQGSRMLWLRLGIDRFTSEI